MSAPYSGLHYVFDAEGCHAPGLVEPAWLTQTLGDLACHLDLTMVSAPRAFVSPCGRTVAAVVLLGESHASIHVEIAARRAHADVFSCRPFDPAAARAFCLDRFAPERSADRAIERNLA